MLILTDSFDMVIPVLSRLVEDIRQNKLDQFPMMPGQVSPFQYTHQMPTWEWYARHKSDGEAFDNYMSDRREYHWYDMFPVGLLDLKDPSSVLLVDVGGGRGHDLQGFQRRYPHLKGRFILQDLSRVINSLDNSLEGIERMAYDFFESQPVQGEYFLRIGSFCMISSDIDWYFFPSRRPNVLLSQYTPLPQRREMRPSFVQHGEGNGQRSLDPSD